MGALFLERYACRLVARDVHWMHSRGGTRMLAASMEARRYVASWLSTWHGSSSKPTSEAARLGHRFVVYHCWEEGPADVGQACLCCWPAPSSGVFTSGWVRRASPVVQCWLAKESRILVTIRPS